MSTIVDMSTEQIMALPADELAALEAQISESYDSGDQAEDAPVADLEEVKPTPEQAESAEEAVSEPVEAQVTSTRIYTAEPPADAEAQLEAAKNAKAEAKKEDAESLRKLHDGEINFEEYSAIKAKADDAIEAANETISSVKMAINNAQIALDMAKQQRNASWQAESAEMTKASKAEGFDYMAQPELLKELNGLLKGFSLEAEERGLSDDNGLEASRYALQQAHALMKARHPELLMTKPETPSQELARRTAEADKANKSRHTLVSLGRMPSADRAAIDGDEISRFSVVPGHDIGKKIAGMSKADAEKLFASI
jgi:hypothetical protein